ncbi:hypothetical protein ACCAA_210002 [Candidatus Accumulibacter aalborgensis]|uniref:Transposase n=1 Tax=Candidatus Accumulibacter aalborgensis TaxID=1860102 RepID=A0A1A8XL54_9PROT|nr:hypothetical protein ACCAA_210002 [Candidatus Accumulibacter aalborgensis]
MRRSANGEFGQSTPFQALQEALPADEMTPAAVLLLELCHWQREQFLEAITVFVETTTSIVE